MNLGAGIAGAGGAAAEESNKYIDQDLAIARAQALADISRTSAVQQHQQIDTYDLSPARQAQMRTNATNATVAQGQAADTVALNTASDAPLTEAQMQRHNITSRGTQAADVAREGAMDAAKVQKLPPGDKAMQGGRVISENTNPTMADVWASGQRQNAGEARDQAVGVNLAGINKEAAEISKQVLEGLQTGTMSKAPKDPANPNDPKDAPHQTWLYAKQRMADLQIQRDQLTQQYQAERASRRPAGGSNRPDSGGSPDPLNLRPGVAPPLTNGSQGTREAFNAEVHDGTVPAAEALRVLEADRDRETDPRARAAAQRDIDRFKEKNAADLSGAKPSAADAGTPPKSSAADAAPTPPPPAPGGIAAAAKGGMVPTSGPTWQEAQRRMNGGAPDPNATVTAGAGQTAAQAAAAPPPPPAILQAARRTSGHEAAKANETGDIERRRAYLAQLPTMFDKDLASLAPLDFAQKYDPLRGDLDTRRATMLQRIEAQVR